MSFPIEVSKFLQALSNENRQRIMLLFAAQSEMTVGEVAQQTGLGMSTVSEHLKQLREAGLLAHEKHGKEVTYTPNVAKIQSALDQLGQYLQRCC